MITIYRYNDTKKEEWDSFVETAKNTTFLFKRNYMDYHKERFTDISLLIYVEEQLYALLPANIDIEKKQIVSHAGLTYGGLLLNSYATTEKVIDIFAAISEFYKKETQATTFIYKPTPYIYHKYPSEEDLYALFINNAKLTERKISSTIKVPVALLPRGRRKLTTAMKNRLHIVQDNNFAAFWNVLEERLKSKFCIKPVHSLKEIELLHSYFPDNIILFRITDDAEQTLGGVVIYITGNVIHVQYSGTTNEGRRIGVLDYLYEYLIKERFATCEYFDFGISVEQGGHYLNKGLISQKEGLGGRGIVYDTYEITL